MTDETFRRRGRHRRVGKVAAAGATVVAAGAAVAAGVGFGFAGPAGGAQSASNLPPASAEVVRQDLVDTKTVDADLGHGPTSSVVNRLPGTLTWAPESGTRVSRGQALYRVDDRPVLLLYGTLPAYRNLRSGDEGADVWQLEQNLAALGYTGFTVDEDYTASTAAAVRTWQKDLGLTQTGTVELGRIVFATGEIRVDSVDAGAGQPAPTGQALLAYTGTARVVTVQVDLADQRLAGKDTPVVVVLPDGRRAQGTITRSYTVVVSGDGPGGGEETRLEAIIALADPTAGSAFEQASVDVVLTASQRTDVLTVPVAALVALAEGGYGVQVIDGAMTRYVAVETGLFAGGRVEITGEGIEAGTTVGMPA